MSGLSVSVSILQRGIRSLVRSLVAEGSRTDTGYLEQLPSKLLVLYIIFFERSSIDGCFIFVILKTEPMRNVCRQCAGIQTF